MADKKITISGSLNLDASKATKALADIQKQFKALEKTNFTKMMTEDFKKLQPVIRGLDKDLNSMMKGMSKQESKSRIQELNKGLQQQANVLKNIVKEQERYNKLMKQSPEGSSLHQFAKQQRDYEAIKGRAVMGSMESAANEKKELSKMDPDTIKKIVVATTAVAVAAGVAGSVANFAMGKELRKETLRAEGMSVNNRLASMMYDKNSTAFGAIAMDNRMTKMQRITDDAQTGGYLSKLGTGVASIVGSFGAALGLSGGNPVAGVAAGGGVLAGQLGHAAEYSPYIGNREEKIFSDRAGYQQQDINAQLQQQSFQIELGDMLLAQAEMKRDTMTSMAGGRGKSGRGLYRAMSANLGVGRSVAGLSMEEGAGAIQALSRVAIGSERQDPEAFRAMMIARQSGAASQGEFTGLVGNMAGTSGRQGSNVKMVSQMLEQAFKAGIDKSQLVSVVKATQDMATFQRAEISDPKSLMKEFLSYLGGDLKSVGAGDIRAAQSAMEEYQGSRRTARGMATGFQATAGWLQELGGQTNDMEAIGVLSNFKNIDQLMQSEIGKKTLMKALGGGAEGDARFSNLMAMYDGGKGKDLIASYSASSFFQEQNLAGGNQFFSDRQNYDRFKDLQKKNQTVGLKGTEATEYEKMFDMFESFERQKFILSGGDEKGTNKLTNRLLGIGGAIGEEGGLAETMAPLDHTARKAAVEAAKNAKAAEPEQQEWMKKNWEATKKGIAEGISTSLGKDGAIGPLVDSLNRLVEVLAISNQIDLNLLQPTRERSLPLPNSPAKPPPALKPSKGTK